MSTQLTSDSNLDLGIFPLGTVGREAGLSRTVDGVPVLDLASGEPLPGPDYVQAIPQPPLPIAADRAESGTFWLEGDVLMCVCPDCHAPMSVRLWLMIADCWKCGTSIELTEEQEREVLRLLKQREATKRDRPPSEAPTAVKTAAPLPERPKPPAPAQTRPALPIRPSPTVGSTLPPPGKRLAAAAPANRRPVARRRRRSWLAGLLRDTPAWLISLVFHLVLLTLLALLTFPPEDEGNQIVLNAIVSRELRQPGQEEIEHPADEVKFDLPVPEKVDLQDHQTREAMLRADQQARELRLVDQADPNVPDLSLVKQEIGSPDGTNVAVVARDPRVRVEMLEQEGGTLLTEAAVARGLRWLAQKQQSDGRWRLDGMQSDSAGTSLALLPFLGAGQTHLAGRYQDEVAKGLRWLIANQKEDGDLRANSTGNSGMYAQGQGAIVLCEAFLMTGDEALRQPAQKAIDFIVEAQYPDGGWRYRTNKETGGHERSDTSVVGWELMALQSARAAKLKVPPETFELASHYLDSAQQREGPLYAYQPGQRPTHVMTAEALLCRVYLGWTKENPYFREGFEYLVDEHLPHADEPNVYYWYYATQAFHHLGGPLWERWNVNMRDVLVNSQEKNGSEAGSWAPRGEHASAGGRVYMTSLAICSLEVYYRHLPIFRQIDVD